MFSNHNYNAIAPQLHKHSTCCLSIGKGFLPIDVLAWITGGALQLQGREVKFRKLHMYESQSKMQPILRIVAMKKEDMGKKKPVLDVENT